jgi:hypothetical protein
MTRRAHDPHPLDSRFLGGAAGAGPTLYSPAQEHDACGTGFVANIDGRRDG